MIVKKENNPLKKIQAILKDQNGILLTSDLAKLGIPRCYLSILLKKGEIHRISRGVYSSEKDLMDEMVAIQARYKAAIFSHETALFLWDLTDRSPLFYSVTVPSGYNASQLKENGIKVYFVKRDLYSIGIIPMKSPHQNEILTFDLERTICDILRSRTRIDIQIVNEALKRYVLHKNRNLDRLYRYAKQFGVQKIAREYLEVLL